MMQNIKTTLVVCLYIYYETLYQVDFSSIISMTISYNIFPKMNLLITGKYLLFFH